jgi:hypothetical protein
MSRLSTALITRVVWPVAGAENYAPCTSGEEAPPGALDVCPFPHARMVDGAYVDNSGIVAALAELERRFPLAPAYRIVASLANGCAPPLTMANCSSSTEGLFANPPGARSGRRYPSTPGQLFQTKEGYLAPSPQIFAESSPKWQAHGAASSFRTLTVNATTVENRAFGIRGGKEVSLFVLFGNAQHCQMVLAPDASEEKVEACAAFADEVRDFLFGMGLPPGVPIANYTWPASAPVDGDGEAGAQV